MCNWNNQLFNGHSRSWTSSFNVLICSWMHKPFNWNYRDWISIKAPLCTCSSQSFNNISAAGKRLLQLSLCCRSRFVNLSWSNTNNIYIELICDGKETKKVGVQRHVQWRKQLLVFCFSASFGWSGQRATTSISKMESQQKPRRRKRSIFVGVPSSTNTNSHPRHIENPRVRQLTWSRALPIMIKSNDDVSNSTTLLFASWSSVVNMLSRTVHLHSLNGSSPSYQASACGHSHYNTRLDGVPLCTSHNLMVAMQTFPLCTNIFQTMCPRIAYNTPIML